MKFKPKKSLGQNFLIDDNILEIISNLGNINKKLGFTKEAIQNYKKAIDTRKNNLQAYFNLAHLYNEEKKFNDLKQVLQNVLDLDKNNTTALNDLGYLNLILGNIDEGRKVKIHWRVAIISFMYSLNLTNIFHALNVSVHDQFSNTYVITFRIVWSSI